MYFDTDDEHSYSLDDVHSKMKIGAETISLPTSIGILTLLLTSCCFDEVKYICYYSCKKYSDEKSIYFDTNNEYSHPLDDIHSEMKIRAEIIFLSISIGILILLSTSCCSGEVKYICCCSSKKYGDEKIIYFDTDDEYLHPSDDVHSQMEIGVEIISLPIGIGILTLFSIGGCFGELKYICYYFDKKYRYEKIIYFDTDNELLYSSNNIYNEMEIGAKIISLLIDIGILNLLLTNCCSAEMEYICYYSSKKYIDKKIMYFDTDDGYSYPSNDVHSEIEIGVEIIFLSTSIGILSLFSIGCYFGEVKYISYYYGKKIKK